MILTLKGSYSKEVTESQKDFKFFLKNLRNIKISTYLNNNQINISELKGYIHFSNPNNA